MFEGEIEEHEVYEGGPGDAGALQYLGSVVALATHEHIAAVSLDISAVKQGREEERDSAREISG